MTVGGFGGIDVEFWTAPGTAVPTRPEFVGLIGPTTTVGGLVRLVLTTTMTIAVGETIVVVSTRLVGTMTVSDSGTNTYTRVPGYDPTASPVLGVAVATVTTALTGGNRILVDLGAPLTPEVGVACALVFSHVSSTVDREAWSTDPGTSVTFTPSHDGDLFVTAGTSWKGSMSGLGGGTTTGIKWARYVNTPLTGTRPALGVAVLTQPDSQTVTAAWHVSTGSPTYFNQMLAAFTP